MSKHVAAVGRKNYLLKGSGRGGHLPWPVWGGGADENFVHNKIFKQIWLKCMFRHFK